MTYQPDQSAYDNFGNLLVHDADAHFQLINKHFIYRPGTVQDTPNGSVSAGATSILLDDATGFVTGQEIVVEEGNTEESQILTVTNVVTNTITLDRPLDNAYTTAANVEVVTHSADVNGSLASPVSFRVTPPADETWHLLRLIIQMTMGTAPDDAKFGNLTALTHGVTIRKNAAQKYTLTNWKDNGDMKEDMYDLDYIAASGAADDGLKGRWTFANAGVAILLDGSASEYLELLVQDDLTGLNTFHVKAQGHVVGV
jgi:hypothetical protein